MSTVIRNINGGPLKLRHDLTPRDIRDYTEGPQTEGALHGFKGFPAHNFERSTQFQTTPENSPRDKFHGLPHHLDTRNPRIFGKAEGMMYGSNGGISNSNPSPRRVNPLNAKTESHYDEGSMSAEMRRYKEQEEDAEVDILKFKQERMKKMMERDDEKKEDMKQLQSYNPWGKPGGGAPKPEGNKKSRLDDVELFNQDVNSPRKQELQEEYGDFHSYFGKPGNGAPIRSNSGKVMAELPASVDIRFQDTQQGRKVYNQEVRYRVPGDQKLNYSSELEKQLEQSKVSKQEQKLSELRKDLEMMRQKDPYGRPGAGAPNKTRSGLHNVFGRRITLSNDIDERRKADYKEDVRNPAVNKTVSDAEIYDPWGKGSMQPVRNKYGDVRRFHCANTKTREMFTENMIAHPPAEDGVMLELGNSRGGAGAPIKTDSGNLKTRYPITMRRDEKGDTTIRDVPSQLRRQEVRRQDSDPELAVYDPFGKAGGGAPMRDDRGAVQANVYGNLQQRSSGNFKTKEAKQQYLDELQRDMESKRMKHDLDPVTGGVEFATIIKQGQVGRPRRNPETGFLSSQHLGTTDVTKEKVAEVSMRNNQSQEYHTELDKAAEDRRHYIQLDRLKSNQQHKQHQQSMNQFWGKPGGGAPNQTYRKGNLEDILYSPRKETNDFYNKNFVGTQPQNCIRNTVNSMHQNMYEYNVPHRRIPKKDYKLMTPYAENREEAF